MESSIPAKDEPDLPEFTWINRQNFTGVQTIDGRKCLVFVAKIDPMQVENPRLFATTSGSGDPDAKVPVTALIDFETRLPVSIAYRNLTMTYQILAAPAGGLAVPPEFVAAAQELDRRIKIRNAPLSPP
ncbi:MAG: hypothetical protein INR62_09705 [Rhodospirillales bacterium]|nr:hypothetical protein [Acetobacter sp.]